MAERLKGDEIEGMARSAAMAPLSTASVTRLVERHAQLSKDWSEVEGLLQRLGAGVGRAPVAGERVQRVLEPG